MFLGIQPHLMERAVFEAVRSDTSLAPLYERQFADCFENHPGHERDRAFLELHEKWFNDLGLRNLIAGLASEFTNLRNKVGRLMVTQAPGPRVQTAELFGAPNRYTVVIAIAPAALLDRPAFQYWARHEFLHIEDMLDPAFGYDATLRPAGSTAAARNLTQDRYAVLWALSVDARLTQRGWIPSGVREKRKTELMRVFAFKNADALGCPFDSLWERQRWFAPTHQQLLAWAQDGLPELRVSEPSSCRRDDRPPAGAPCPLCGFPTFDWADPSDEKEQALESIRHDFPDWSPTQGLCGRCAEVYRTCTGLARQLPA